MLFGDGSQDVLYAILLTLNFAGQACVVSSLGLVTVIFTL